MKITAITKQEYRDRYNIFVDGEFRLAIDAGVLAGSGLAEGQEIDVGRIGQLQEEDLPVKIYAKAIEYLSRRLHARAELRRKLSAKFEPAAVEPVLDRLTEQGYLNDAEFVQRWITLRGGNRGPAKLRAELLAKGIESELIQEILVSEQGDRGDDAYELALARLSRFTSVDWSTAKPKLARYLASRGYDYDTVRGVLDRVNREQLIAP